MRSPARLLPPGEIYYFEALYARPERLLRPSYLNAGASPPAPPKRAENHQSPGSLLALLSPGSFPPAESGNAYRAGTHGGPICENSSAPRVDVRDDGTDRLWALLSTIRWSLRCCALVTAVERLRPSILSPDP